MLKIMFYMLPHNMRTALRGKNFLKPEEDSPYKLDSYRENKCIFVHIPKAAGTSVNLTLFGDYGAGHTSVKRYQYMFSKADYDSYFKFTFIRNPWSRLYSAYRHIISGGSEMFPLESDHWIRQELAPYRNFDEFVREWMTADNIKRHVFFTPQYQFLINHKDKIEIDFIGFFENIQQDFSYVVNRLSADKQGSLKPMNRSAAYKKDYKDVYSDDARAIVAEIYKKDIELFAYNFDNSSLPAQLARREHGT